MGCEMAANQNRSGLLGLIMSNLDTIGVVAKWLLPASFTGAVVGWATWFAGIFQQYAPASWIFATVIGALLGLIGMALFAYARERIQIVKFRNNAFDNSRINPVDTIFTSRRIRVIDLAPPMGAIIEGKTFIDCDIVGPANVMFEGCHFHANRGEIVDAIIIKPGMIPKNGFGFRNCIFRQCRIYSITFMVPEPDYRDFTLPAHSGLNWITERPDQPPLPMVMVPSNAEKTET
jgi:hypothetical protein